MHYLRRRLRGLLSLQLDTAVPWLALCLTRGIAAGGRGGCQDIVERTGLGRMNSSDVLATFFDWEMKGLCRQLPGKQFGKKML